MRKLCAVPLLFAIFCVAGARAWWCVAHMVIAEIARQNLNYGVEDKVNELIKFLNYEGGFSQSPDMVNAACWADELKSNKLYAMAGWHFINQPYDPTGVPLKPHWPIQHDNVAQNIMTLSDTLKKQEGMNIWIKSFAVANLLHFYGDLHQPLHATDMFDSTFPDGDRGGNLFPVWFQGKQWRLHFIWDSVCGQYQNTPKRPLSYSSKQWIESLAQQYMTNFTVSAKDKATYNATIMAEESLDYAIRYSYLNHTLQPNATITPDYVAQCEVAAGQRIAMAGWRLAHDLNFLFKDHDKGKEVSAEAIMQRMVAAKKEVKEAMERRSDKMRAPEHF